MANGLSMAVLGSSLVSACWNGEAICYPGLLQAIVERGHRVSFYEPNAYERQRHRDMADPDWARVTVYPATEAAALDALESARGHNIVSKPGTHFTELRDPRFEADVAFLGHRMPDRESRVDEFFFQAAERLPGRRLLLGGSGWGGWALPVNMNYAGYVYTQDHNALNSTALSVLNASRASMAACRRVRAQHTDAHRAARLEAVLTGGTAPPRPRRVARPALETT